MNLKKGTGTVWKWIGIFFAAMVIFTVLSRAIYQYGTAVVTTAPISTGTIDHTVQITGKVQQNQEIAVTTIGGLRVGTVCVNEGEQVKQGDVLFILDMDYLNEQIQKQQQDMKKQQLSVWDAWAQYSNAQKQKEQQQSQAENNYDNAVSQAQTQVDRAKRDLDRAKEALENYYNGISNDQAEEDALLSACQEAKTEYDNAAAALEDLKKEIEEAVQTAITQDEEALQQGIVPPSTQPPETVSSVEQNGEAEAPTQTQETTAGEPVNVIRELTPEEKMQIETKVRSIYADRLSAAEAAKDQAKKGYDDAQAALDIFYQRQNSGMKLTEQDYLDAVEAAQEKYDDALANLESVKTTYGNAIDSANLSASTSNSAQIGQITYDQMALQLEKLEALWDMDGQILSPTEGIVTKCNVQTGEKTTDTTAILLADLRQGCKFTGLVAEEDSQYIGVGDRVLLQSGGGKVYKDLPVSTFSAAEELGGGYRITVQIDSNQLSLGENLNLSYTKKSQPYSICIPLAALRLDERNQPYVLVVEEANSIMGRELQAKKVSVTVLERNNRMAALEAGTLGAKDKVIVSSDHEIEHGSRIRVE